VVIAASSGGYRWIARPLRSKRSAMNFAG